MKLWQESLFSACPTFLPSYPLTFCVDTAPRGVPVM